MARNAPNEHKSWSFKMPINDNIELYIFMVGTNIVEDNKYSPGRVVIFGSHCKRKKNTIYNEKILKQYKKVFKFMMIFYKRKMLISVFP